MEIKIFNQCREECEFSKKNVLYRCRHYIHLEGKNPQTGEITNEWNCTFSWIPILLVGMSKNIFGLTQAVESSRNETNLRQDVSNAALTLLTSAATSKNTKEIEIAFAEISKFSQELIENRKEITDSKEIKEIKEIE
jgi:hypothetical protein